MVVERRCGMKRNQAEQKKPDRFVHLQELLRERAVPADQRRQLAEEEQFTRSPCALVWRSPRIGWVSKRA